MALSSNDMHDSRPPARLPCCDTIVIYDLEFTSWPGFADSGWSLPGKHPEIIQIGAVMLDVADGFGENNSFECLVRPTVNPVLSDYIVLLTGISQEWIERDGLPFAEALDQFKKFVEPADGMWAYGTDQKIIERNCRLTGISYPHAFDRSVNLRPLFTEALETQGPLPDSGDLLTYMDLPPVGHAHDGLVDARSLAEAIRHLVGVGRME
ncbi:MAG: hypothetical protein CFH05_00401 [Alphaproteobacteria bacterium MarineAlpha3_Bin4]|nr:MAG: hypothetical protein CFH05_00401 [Alphaproteobacteria bacterium MarineAlpha3_Bin4]